MEALICPKDWRAQTSLQANFEGRHTVVLNRLTIAAAIKTSGLPLAPCPLGELVRCTDGRSMARPPQRCPRGHRLGAHRVLVGHQPCSCRGGHTGWTCLECGATVYGPPLRVDCRVLAGPAARW